MKESANEGLGGGATHEVLMKEAANEGLGSDVTDGGLDSDDIGIVLVKEVIKSQQVM